MINIIQIILFLPSAKGSMDICMKCASSLTETDLLYLRMVFGSFHLVHGQNRAAIMQLMLNEEEGREYILTSIVVA